MTTSSQFVDHVVNLMEPLGAVRAKPMFGGFGIFLDDTMFALVTKAGVLHLKADDVNRGSFEAQGLGRYGKMPYFEIPPAALEDQDDFLDWAREAVAASQRKSG